jgi:hypothetical protein
MAPLPLVIFYSFTSRDTFVNELRLQRCHPENDSGPLLEMHENHLDLYIGDNNVAIYVTVCRAPGGVQGFMEKAARLFSSIANGNGNGDAQALFEAAYIFHPELPPHGTYERHENRVFINYTVREVLQQLGLDGTVNDAQRNKLQQCLQSNRPQAPLRLELINRIRLFDDVGAAAAFGGPDDQDHELQLALRASIEEDEERRRSRAPSQEKKEALSQAISSWPLLSEERAAAPNQLAAPGEPVCTVCLENRVAICFVPCGHQTVCDRCVRAIWTQDTLARACPTCRGAVSGVVRPVLAATAPSQQKSQRKRQKVINLT